MSTIKLLKARSFGEIIQDSFQFIGRNFIHFTSNFIIINGVFLVLTFLRSYYFGAEIKSFDTIQLVYITIVVIGGLISFAFTPIYMALYHKNNGAHFNYKDIFEFYKANFSKILIYFLVTLLLFLPLIIGFYIALIIITITVIGILLWPILFAFIYLLFAFPLYEYLNSDKGIFECYGYAFSLIFKRFFAVTSAIALIYTIIIVAYFVILAALGLFSSFVGIDFKDTTAIQTAMQSYFEVLSSPLTLLISIVIQILIASFSMSTGIAYYSQKEVLEKINQYDELDQLGQDY